MLEFNCGKNGDRLSHHAAPTPRGTQHCRPLLGRGARQEAVPHTAGDTPAGRGCPQGTPGTAAAVTPRWHLACFPSKDAGKHPSPLPREMEMLIHPAGAEKSSWRREAPARSPPRSRREATAERL